MRQVAAKRGTEVLLDDVGVVLNAREWHTFPAALQTAFCATRKAKCNFNWTAQYLGSGRWYVALAYMQWDNDLSGYVATKKNWFFDEAKGALTTAG